MLYVVFFCSEVLLIVIIIFNENVRIRVSELFEYMNISFKVFKGLGSDKK